MVARVRILQIWAWEHIPVCKPVVDDSREAHQPIACRYLGYLTQTHLGKIGFWRHQLDDLIAVVCRLYRVLEECDDQRHERRLMFMTCPLIGRSQTVIEQFVVSQVMRQYGRMQAISQEFSSYARFRDKERKGWGPQLSYALAVQVMIGLQPQCSDYLQDIVDAGVTPEYRDDSLRHPFSQFIDPIERAPRIDQDVENAPTQAQGQGHIQGQVQEQRADPPKRAEGDPSESNSRAPVTGQQHRGERVAHQVQSKVREVELWVQRLEVVLAVRGRWERVAPQQVRQQRDEPTEGGEEEIPRRQTLADMIRILRGKVRTLQTQLAVAQKQFIEHDQEVLRLRGKLVSSRCEVLHQSSRATYYVSAYSTVVLADKQVAPYSQYMARAEGAQAPRQVNVLQEPPPPPRDEGEGQSQIVIGSVLFCTHHIFSLCNSCPDRHYL